MSISSIQDSPSFRRASSSSDVVMLIDSSGTSKTSQLSATSASNVPTTRPSVSSNVNTSGNFVPIPSVSSSGDNNAKIIGGAVGGSLGVLALLFLGFLAYRWKVGKAIPEQLPPQARATTSQADNVYTSTSDDQARVQVLEYHHPDQGPISQETTRTTFV